MISDTRHIAERALRASKAYQDITDAINQALNASLAAIDTAEQAFDLVSQIFLRFNIETLLHFDISFSLRKGTSNREVEHFVLIKDSLSCLSAGA